MRELKISYPVDRKVEILTKDQEFCRKAKIANDKKEKQGKFYVLKGYLPKCEVFVPKGENVKKYLENYAKKLSKTSVYKTA
jgi:hypothetical protein